MTGSKVTVRYGCDGCGRLYDDKDKLTVVEIFRVSGGRQFSGEYTYESRAEALCKDCLRSREGGRYVSPVEVV